MNDSNFVVFLQPCSAVPVWGAEQFWCGAAETFPAVCHREPQTSCRRCATVSIIVVWCDFCGHNSRGSAFREITRPLSFVPFQDSGVWTLPSPSFGRRSSRRRTQTTSSRRWWRVWTTWNCRITPASRSCARNCWLLLARASSLSICLDLTSCTLTQNGLQSTHCRTTQIVTSSFRVALPLSFPPFSFLFFKHPHWGKICTAYLFKEKQLAETKQ